MHVWLALSAVDVAVAETSATRTGMPFASDDAEAMRGTAQPVRDAGNDSVATGTLAAPASFQ